MEESSCFREWEWRRGEFSLRVVREDVSLGLLRKPGSETDGLGMEKGSGQTACGPGGRRLSSAQLAPDLPSLHSWGTAAAAHHPSTSWFNRPAFPGSEIVLIPFGFHHGGFPGCLITFTVFFSHSPGHNHEGDMPLSVVGMWWKPPLSVAQLSYSTGFLWLFHGLISVTGCRGGIA